MVCTSTVAPIIALIKPNVICPSYSFSHALKGALWLVVRASTLASIIVLIKPNVICNSCSF